MKINDLVNLYNSTRLQTADKKFGKYLPLPNKNKQFFNEQS